MERVIRLEIMELVPKQKLESKFTFPKKVGIVFVERRSSSLRGTVNKKFVDSLIKLKIIDESKRFFDFDQDVCSYFILQMNHVQSTFEFQVVETTTMPQDLAIIDWLDGIAKSSVLDIDYWIAITDQGIGMVEITGSLILYM